MLPGRLIADFHAPGRTILEATLHKRWAGTRVSFAQRAAYTAQAAPATDFRILISLKAEQGT